MCLSVLPSFASAEVIDVLKDKEGILSNSAKTKALTDGSDSTSISLSTWDIPSVKFDLEKDYLIKSYFIKAFSRSGKIDVSTVFYDSDNKKINSFAGTENNVNVSGVRYVEFVSTNGNFRLDIQEVNVFASDGKVSNVSDLDAISDVNKITLNWKNPTEENWSKYALHSL